ncbi:DUF5605 domain-containing protein [Anaerocolumna sp. AGMB13025]|uniref:DUF5605 domain-containing protein n=1 Tax=Anaerocolumna sp. AGMB13025 TaxID=3039116 RepID=UPI00241C25DA|nr:DUF5605 domain-containing protein [Anaerocolumna sp. AGMB13025]WFR55704.1 DUF5605 domain-containing protein [Anaerocolumna sp. AGMB13025]
MNDFIYTTSIEKWDTFEAVLPGFTKGNPFADYTITGYFKSSYETKTVDGFYDGNGNYIVRFMPSFEGEYQFIINGTFSSVEYNGSFSVTSPSADNHGPVRVASNLHLIYEDGTPYHSLGTTCYAWTHQSAALQEQTLKTLSENAFNKLRFCVFPKHYLYNFYEPVSYPYEGTPCDSTDLNEDNFVLFSDNNTFKGNQWDYKRFNPSHFQNFEKRIKDLRDLGIEADIILMHPYDRWGFSHMGPENEAFYLRYVLARFSAYRNVWWSLANEYDIFTHKSIADWEANAKEVYTHDPYNHLRSIHNCFEFYDFNRPWITHCSIQRLDLYKTAECTTEWRLQYKKPVVLDEIAYEGNINHAWGNISGQEMTRRFWECFVRGGYPGHGETYQHPKDLLWWSHGGTLHGESPARIKFLSEIMQQTPSNGLIPVKGEWDEVLGIADGGAYAIHYYSLFRPGFRTFSFPPDQEYEVEVIDTWNMTIEKMGPFLGKCKITLPGKEFMAIRIIKK